MFESDDWIFENAFNEDDIEEQTRKKSHSPCQKEEEMVDKRCRVDSCKILPSLSTGSTFIQQSELHTVTNVEDNNPPFENENSVSRGNLLLRIFQKDTLDTPQETLDHAKNIENDLLEVQRKTQCFQFKINATSKVFQYEESREKNRKTMTEKRLAKKEKLIRIFPGPAGLIPDVKNDNNIFTTSYLSNVEELERNKAATKCIEIKSQDENNLFEKKAWKLLLNDLPKNFLQDYKISIVKDKVNTSHCDSTKVRFLAGVLDYIDHSHDDPFIVLKDSTGSIEGTIHRSIPLTYPGILEPNVAILLHDVGLLKTTKYVVTNKYHILVSLTNLLAIYSDKGRIVSTSLMESISFHTSDVELNRINDCTPLSKSLCISELQKMDESCNASWRANSSIDLCSSRIEVHESELPNDQLFHPMSEKYESRGEAFKDDEKCKVTDKIFENFNFSMGTDDTDNTNVFFTDDNFILEKQNRRDQSLCNSTCISQASKIQRCNLSEKVKNMKHFENIEKKSTTNVQKKMEEQRPLQTLQKCITPTKTWGAQYSRTDLNVNVRSTLPEIKHNRENSKTLASYFTSDNGYDSDDQILSQLDVDDLFDTLKEGCSKEKR